MSTEELKKAIVRAGGNVDDLPDNLMTTLMQRLCDTLGIDTSDMSDKLVTSYLKQISSEYSGGGSGGGEKTMTDTLTFDGNVEGKVVLPSPLGGTVVNVYDKFVPFSDLLGGTFTVQNVDSETFEKIEGSVVTHVISESTSHIVDFSETTGFPAYLVHGQTSVDFVVSEQDVYSDGNLVAKKGISFGYSLEEDKAYVSELKAPNAVFSVATGGSGGGSGESEPVTLQDKTITENGTYTADEGYTGLGIVTVEVESSGGGSNVILDTYEFTGTFAQLPFESGAITGQKLLIIFDGVTYECEPFYNRFDYMYYGNGNLEMGGTATGKGDTSLPFLLDPAGYLDVSTDGTHTIKIELPSSSGSAEIPTCTVRFVSGENVYTQSVWSYSKCENGVISTVSVKDYEQKNDFDITLENVVCGSIIHFQWDWDGDMAETSIDGTATQLADGFAVNESAMFSAPTVANEICTITLNSPTEGGDDDGWW